MQQHQTVQLGDKVQDKVTTFEGIVTGVADYITGCRQCLVQPPAKDGEYKDGRWIDDDRLLVLQKGHTVLDDRRRDGGPQANPAPVR